jgi:hypothetical protein
MKTINRVVIKILAKMLVLVQLVLFSYLLAYNAYAHSQFSPTGATLVVGTTAATDLSNTGSWKGTFGSDDNYWTVTRIAAATSLNMNIESDNIELNNANKIIITIEDSNITTATAYFHQICDWTSSTNVDNAADANCTGGGWRTLNPRKTTYTNTTDTSRIYEIYNGYFWDRTTSFGTVINTPLSNFVNTGNNRVLIRIFSNINAVTQYRLDTLQIETAVDPVYEPAAYTKTQAGTTTGFISDLIGSATTGVTATDGNKLTVPMSAVSTAVDHYFSFKDIRSYTGANTFLIMPEICVSNVALTFTPYLYNFANSTWTQLGTAITGSACTTDTEYSFAFNSTTISGFNFGDHISGNEVRFRILTNAPGVVYNMQIDRVYMMLGTVNADSADCEISWGTGTASNCTNTRSAKEAKTGTPATTWQATAALEYPASFYSLDNDDDTTNAEYAASQNLSFPVTLASNMSVTAIHYAAKYRSNSTAQTADLQIRDYSGVTGTSGWVNTPGTDSSSATTYAWFDTWTLAELQLNPSDTIDTIDNKMNLRLRTSSGTTTNPGTRDWSYAMMSIRWTEESNLTYMRNKFTPTSGQLVTGSEVATSNTNVGSWRGTMGNDSASNNGGNYWTTARNNPAGLNKHLIFDSVELYGANKMIIVVEDSNITTANDFIHQICDWASSSGVDNAADAQCTGGGWRTLNERKVVHTNTSDSTKTYEIYNGYFSDRITSPGVVYSTPLSNFVRTTNKRVLIRTYSTIASTVEHRTELIQIETAIDPVYEPSSFTKINSYAGATSNFISDIRGTTASDANKLTFTNAASNPLDVYFTFKNVKSYSGANTILIKPEVCVSTTALTFNFGIYNFNSSSWETLNGSAITGTACTTDTAYAYAKNNITLSNYISNGEIRVRINTSVLNTNTLQIDRLYLMIGSTNTDTADCEISWGTGTAANCSNTRNIGDVETGSSATSTWQPTAVLEYPSSYYSLDNDDDTTNLEAASAMNLSFPVTVSSGMSVTGIHYASRFRSNNTGMTFTLNTRDFGGKFGTSGWSAIGTTNAATTYIWSDSWQSAELFNAPLAYIDTASNKVNLRLRTSASTLLSAGTVSDWDFAMMSIRWIEQSSRTLSVDIVDAGGSSVASPSIGFNNVETAFTCQTTTGTFGVSNEKIRIYNTTSQPQWSLNVAAVSGSSSTWQSGGNNYDYNDDGGSPQGCGDAGDGDSFAGQMNFDFSSAVITPQSGCSSTGISLGTNAGFDEGSVDNITIAMAGSGADTNCYWDITNIVVTQKIPNSQANGNYSLPMSLSIIAN